MTPIAPYSEIYGFQCCGWEHAGGWTVLQVWQSEAFMPEMPRILECSLNGVWSSRMIGCVPQTSSAELLTLTFTCATPAFSDFVTDRRMLGCLLIHECKDQRLTLPSGSSRSKYPFGRALKKDWLAGVKR